MRRSYRDKEYLTDENEAASIAAIAVIGGRREQQDCVGWSLQPDGGLFAVCDGMGGHARGQRASSTAIDRLLAAFERDPATTDPAGFLQRTAMAIDREIHAMKGPSGAPLGAGATLVSAFIDGTGLYWFSVGDSRLYLYRAGALAQVTQDHVYRVVLGGLLEKGEITRERYDRDLARGEALISYLGIGNLQLVDNNSVPLRLRPGDRLLLASDGLYKAVPDATLRAILRRFDNACDALLAMDRQAEKNTDRPGVRRDNLTAALIRIK